MGVRVAVGLMSSDIKYSHFLNILTYKYIYCYISQRKRLDVVDLSLVKNTKQGSYSLQNLSKSDC